MAICSLNPPGNLAIVSVVVAKCLDCGKPVRLDRAIHQSNKESTRVFVRDGFLDRYTGERLIFPPVLRVLSIVLPDKFPYHPNWKTVVTHPAFWKVGATIDHVVPVTRGGADDESNWVTTSMARNSAKMNWTLEELGWTLHPPGNFGEWDGLLHWFLEYTATTIISWEIRWFAGGTAQQRWPWTPNLMLKRTRQAAADSTIIGQTMTCCSGCVWPTHATEPLGRAAGHAPHPRRPDRQPHRPVTQAKGE